MTDDRWIDIRRTLEEALEVAPEQRDSLIRRLCAEREIEVDQVHSLLESVLRLGDRKETRARGEPTVSVQTGAGSVPPDETRRMGEPGSHPSASSGSSLVDQAIDRIRTQSEDGQRYRQIEEIGRGGMGAVLRVRDEHLQRDVAMKVMLESYSHRERSRESGEPGDNAPFVARFMDEALISGQLEHPGIVPVHELGIDDGGRVWFTMRLVRGITLGEVIEQRSNADSDWPLPRVVNLVLKACEAVAYAHSKGVVHRDLKPANIMVGRFGEVYVMDWGLAKAAGRQDHRDLRPRVEPPRTTSLRTIRKADVVNTPDSPLVTMDGAVVGTPAYMAPEQAKGLLEEVGVRSDVYAMGAILYEILAGQMPYVERGARMSPHTVLAMVIAGPPRELDRIAPDVPAELAAICRKAMARDASKRYSDMLDLAEDLRAYLEQRVVRAYQTGAVAEFSSWVRRNRGTALAAAAAVLLAIVGSVGISIVQSRARSESESRLAEIRQLADVKLLADLKERSRSVGPDLPTGIESLRTWLDSARELSSRLSLHRDTLLRLRDRALPYDDAAAQRDRSTHPNAEELRFLREERARVQAKDPSDGAIAALDAKIDALEAAVRVRRTYQFESEAEAWQHATLSDLVAGLERFVEPTRLGVGNPERATLEWIAARLRDAETIEQRSLIAHGEAWDRALAEIRAADSPYRETVKLRAQVGLVPLGKDPRTGFQEFGHVQTGSLPERNERGDLVLPPDCGLVFVLLPGGKFSMGSQRESEQHPVGSPNVDPNSNASGSESPPHEVTLTPFFLSKFELTQAQWARVQGSNPSKYQLGDLHPVEQISYNDASALLLQLGLQLPTEAQWEYAARAATTTIYPYGNAIEDLRGAANLADRTARLANVGQWAFIDDLEDGFAFHAPIGSFRPNGFGLHDVCGNVWEWCRDQFLSYSLPPRNGDGLRSIPMRDRTERVSRGGAFLNGAVHLRVACRANEPPDKRGATAQGVRPARAIDE